MFPASSGQCALARTLKPVTSVVGGSWTYVKDQPNVYVDTSSDYLNPSIVKKAVDTLGYRKVLYGCDGPYGMKKFNEYDYLVKKSWIDSLQIPDKEKEYILGRNFLGLIE